MFFHHAQAGRVGCVGDERQAAAGHGSGHDGVFEPVCETEYQRAEKRDGGISIDGLGHGIMDSDVAQAFLQSIS